MKKSIGIIGAGQIGKTLATLFAKAGYDVSISNSKGPESLQETVQALGNGVKAASRQEAANSDILILAVPWLSKENALKDLPDMKGKIVIDAMNAYIAFTPVFKLADLGDRASSEVIAELLPGARVVKAFNTLYFKILELDPQEASGRRVIFLSGDDPEAKKVVAELISSTGFAPIDLGELKTGGKMQQAGSPLASVDLIKKS